MPVNATNTPPEVHDETYAVHAGHVLTVPKATGLLANDSDADGDALWVPGYEPPAHGTMSLLTDGAFSYTPEAGFVGSVEVDYTVSDGITEQTGTVTILVQNAAPEVQDETYAVHAGHVLTVPKAAGLLANDSDADGDALWVPGYEPPAHGTMSLLTDGAFSYTPEAGFVGSVEVDYTVSDGITEQTGTVTILVQNAAPEVQDETYAVHAGHVLTVPKATGLLANDSDADGDALWVPGYEPPVHGTMSLLTDGSFSYTPEAGFFGREEVEYTVSDGLVQQTGTVTIEVVPETAIVHLGDASGMVTTRNPDVWAPFWTDAAVSIRHKANLADGAQAWSPVVLNALGSATLAGGDLYGGDLGVSGKSLDSSGPNQELQGAEALRFDLAGVATRVTVDLSRLFRDDDANTFGHHEAGRLQALDESGAVLAEQLFVAGGTGGVLTVTLERAAGFHAVVISAGAYDGGGAFIHGAYAHEAGDMAAAPYAAAGRLHGSDFMLDSIEFDLVVAVGVAAEPGP